MASLSEHVIAIKAAIQAAKDDGFEFEIDYLGECEGHDMWLTINKYGPAPEGHPYAKPGVKVVIDWDTVFE